MVFELSDANYSQTVEENDKAIFIDFYSPSCGPCQELLPKLPRLADVFQDDALICKVDVTHNPKLAQKYEIRSVPFCVSIGTDKIIKDYELGSPSIDRLISMIKKAQGKGFFARLFG
ncbi:MAG: thioredoxin domain-containing protein [Campylobacterota bacterium]|nr:thioredoxin domain-containing protein [Campylobacterota bacterium]